MSISFSLSLSLYFKRFVSPAGSCRLQAPAMDARAAKRLAQVDHIRSKPYYSQVNGEPDPYTKTVSTRAWKHTMKVWIETLKKSTCNAGQPHHEGAAPDVTARSR